MTIKDVFRRTSRIALLAGSLFLSSCGAYVNDLGKEIDSTSREFLPHFDSSYQTKMVQLAEENRNKNPECAERIYAVRNPDSKPSFYKKTDFMYSEDRDTRDFVRSLSNSAMRSAIRDSEFVSKFERKLKEKVGLKMDFKETLDLGYLRNDSGFWLGFDQMDVGIHAPFRGSHLDARFYVGTRDFNFLNRAIGELRFEFGPYGGSGSLIKQIKYFGQETTLDLTGICDSVIGNRTSFEFGLTHNFSLRASFEMRFGEIYGNNTNRGSEDMQYCESGWDWRNPDKYFRIFGVLFF
jgi:hypothetical protein